MKTRSQWIAVKNKVINELPAVFRKHPQYYFSEHDIHSVLYHLTREQLKQHGESSQITLDGYETSLVHHEYPTPFRCDMQGYKFQRVSEEKRTPKDGLYKRGHYDLVILNPTLCQKQHTRHSMWKKLQKTTSNSTKNAYPSINLGLRNHLLPKNQKTTQKRN